MGIAILLSAHLLQAVDVQMATAASSDTLTLREVTVKAVFSNPKNSPLRLSEIDSGTLKARASSRT